MNAFGDVAYVPILLPFSAVIFRRLFFSSYAAKQQVLALCMKVENDSVASPGPRFF